MSMMYCWGCGKQIHESAPMCPNCGALQRKEAQGQATSSARPTPKAATDSDSLFSYYTAAFAQKYASFGGRARRREYWGFLLFNMVAAFACAAVDGMVGTWSSSGAAGAFYGLYLLAAFLPGLGVAVRRLHDVSKSGWNILWGVLPILGWIYFLVLMCRDSDRQANQYGSSPKYEQATA